MPRAALIPSMKRRKSGLDYTGRRLYLITLVVSGRRPLMGEVKGDDAGGALFRSSPLGEAVDRQIDGIPRYYPQVRVVARQLMPDHVHMILFVQEQLPVKLGIVIRGFVQGCNKMYKQLYPSTSSSWKDGTPNGRADSWSGRAPVLKATSNHRGDGILFEHGYNDRVLSHEGQLACWKQYLADNPRRLWEKRQHPDLFRVQRHLEVKGMMFSAIGNKFLLDRPLVQVRCSRSLTDDDVAREKAKALAACESGAVLVSPCVSKGEKAVMRAAFEAGYPEVVLVENGFTELAKPGGKRFDACAEGRLLILAPWEHHNDRRTITRSQCLELNEMARRLCQA